MFRHGVARGYEVVNLYLGSTIGSYSATAQSIFRLTYCSEQTRKRSHSTFTRIFLLLHEKLEGHCSQLSNRVKQIVVIYISCLFFFSCHNDQLKQLKHLQMMRVTSEFSGVSDTCLCSDFGA